MKINMWKLLLAGLFASAALAGCEDNRNNFMVDDTISFVNEEQYAGVSVYNGKYELAMIPLTGWEKTYTVYPEGVHPVSEKCALNMVSDQLSGEKIYVTLQLWKKNEKRGFTSKELTPVKSVHVSEDKKQVTVCLSNGEIKTISFE